MKKKSGAKKVIGVLGGMGPIASVYFYAKLIEVAQKNGAKEDDDFPRIVINSLPLRGLRSTGIDLNNPDVVEDLQRGVKALELSGCDFVVIACNTVHKIFPKIQSAIQIPILHMIEETIRAVGNAGCSSVGILATETTIQSRMYEDALGRIDICPILPTKREQEAVTLIIDNISKGVSERCDRRSLMRIVDNMVDRGAEGIILGCTELPLLDLKNNHSVRVFSASDILAELAIMHAM